MTSDKPFFLRNQYKLMAQRQGKSQWVRPTQTSWLWFPPVAESLCSPLAIVCVTEPVSGLTRALLYIAGLAIIFLSLDFSQWRSRAENVLTLNLNIQSPLFLSTWSRARDLRNSFGLVCKVVQTARNQISSVTGPTMAKPFDVSQPRGYTIAISFYP